VRLASVERLAPQVAAVESFADVLRTTPITGTVACRARATIGHIAPTPPSSVMNSRRLIQSQEQATGLLEFDCVACRTPKHNSRSIMNRRGHALICECIYFVMLAGP
jgi:hypothetical protein